MPKPKPHLKNLIRTNIHDRLRRNFLRLDMNESPSGLPEAFIKKVLSEIDTHFIASYPEYNLVQRRIAKYNQLKPENICLANGSDAAIKYIFDAYISGGDRVLMTDPTFAMYPVYCQMFDAKPVAVSYNQDFSFPLKDFMQKINSAIKMAVIVNPNNPTGGVLKREGLLKIIRKAKKYHVLVIVDEAYFYFHPTTVIREVRHFNNLIVLRTFSKLCAMAALRFGYAAADPNIIEHLRKVKPTYDVNSLALLFAERLLEKPKIIGRLIKETNNGKNYLAKRLKEQNLEFRKGNANFILIKCGNRINEIVKKLAEKDILVHAGFRQNFLKDYIRITVGNRRDMEVFWKVFIRIWENAPSRPKAKVIR